MEITESIHRLGDDLEAMMHVVYHSVFSHLEEEKIPMLAESARFETRRILDYHESPFCHNFVLGHLEHRGQLVREESHYECGSN